MKFSLLLLLLPLQSFAQFGRSYTGPTMQQNQLSRQQFNNTMNRYNQDYQQRMLDRRYSRSSGMPLNRERMAQARAKQQKLEQDANESLARLAQQQQRQEHPAKDPQAAAAQQRADDKQLNLLAVKNYRDVFLTAQIASVLEAQQFSPSAQQSFANLDDNLSNERWWHKQDKAQLVGQVKAYSDSLASLTNGLLGFNMASPPAKPAPFAASTLDEMLKKDTFDQAATGQFIREAALSERLLASDQLIKAVQEFNGLAEAAAASPAAPDVKKMMHDVRTSLRTVNSALARYQGRLASSNAVFSVEKALRKSTSAYLAKNDK